MRLILKHEAVEDMVEIYKYSVVAFGERKADEYYEGLDKRLNELANGEVIVSYDYSFVSAGLRRVNYKSHSVYYRVEAESVIVSRVLNSRMDGARHID